MSGPMRVPKGGKLGRDDDERARSPSAATSGERCVFRRGCMFRFDRPRG